MVRSTHKTNIIFISLITALSLILAGSSMSTPVSATDPQVTFNVNLTEVLTVSITNPTSWATGATDTLLRNKVTVSALTNNYYGATVSMYAADTALKTPNLMIRPKPLPLLILCLTILPPTVISHLMLGAIP